MTPEEKLKELGLKFLKLSKELNCVKRERAEAERLVRQAFEDARRGMSARGGLTTAGEKWLRDGMKILKRIESRRKGA